MLVTLTSSKSPAEIAEAAPKVAQEHGWSFLGEHRLKEKLNAKGFALDPDVRVLEVCSPSDAYKVLSTHLPISTALPCRISLYPGPEGTVVATLKPTELLGIFDRPDLADTAAKVEREILALMEDLV